MSLLSLTTASLQMSTTFHCFPRHIPLVSAVFNRFSSSSELSSLFFRLIVGQDHTISDVPRLLVPDCEASVVRIDGDSARYKAIPLGGIRIYSISQSRRRRRGATQRHRRRRSCEIDRNASPKVPEIGKADPEDEEISATTLVAVRDSGLDSFSGLIHIARASCIALPGSKP